jgi:hypothetical protein
MIPMSSKPRSPVCGFLGRIGSKSGYLHSQKCHMELKDDRFKSNITERPLPTQFFCWGFMVKICLTTGYPCIFSSLKSYFPIFSNIFLMKRYHQYPIRGAIPIFRPNPLKLLGQTVPSHIRTPCRPRAAPLVFGAQFGAAGDELRLKHHTESRVQSYSSWMCFFPSETSHHIRHRHQLDEPSKSCWKNHCPMFSEGPPARGGGGGPVGASVLSCLVFFREAVEERIKIKGLKDDKDYWGDKGWSEKGINHPITLDEYIMVYEFGGYSPVIIRYFNGICQGFIYFIYPGLILQHFDLYHRDIIGSVLSKPFQVAEMLSWTISIEWLDVSLHQHVSRHPQFIPLGICSIIQIFLRSFRDLEQANLNQDWNWGIRNGSWYYPTFLGQIIKSQSLIQAPPVRYLQFGWNCGIPPDGHLDGEIPWRILQRKHNFSRYV